MCRMNLQSPPQTIHISGVGLNQVGNGDVQIYISAHELFLKLGMDLELPKLEHASCYYWELLELPKMEVGGREINPHLKPDRCWTEDPVASRRGP